MRLQLATTLEQKQALSDFVNQLLFVVATETRLPLQDGSRAPLELLGLSVLGSPRERPPEASWLRQSAVYRAQRTAGLMETSTRGYFLAVQWRNLLSKAFLRHARADHTPQDVRLMAHHAWWALIPVVERYDVVLTELLKRARFNYLTYTERVKNEPYWLGIDNEHDERRFDAQVSYLLSLRWTNETPHGSFCEDAANWFNAALAPAMNAVEQRHFGLCSVGDHRGGTRCPKCPETAADRRYIGVFDGDALKKHSTRWPLASLDSVVPEAHMPSGPMETTVHNLRWVIEARSRLDGVARCTTYTGVPARLIHIPRLKESWTRLDLPSVLDDFDLTKPEDMGRAYQFMLGFVGTSVLPSSALPFSQVYLESEWGTVKDFDVESPYLVAVADTALLHRLARAGLKSAALKKATMTKRSRAQARPDRRELLLEYQPVSGEPAHPIRMVRAVSAGGEERNFFSTPFPVERDNLRRSQSGMGILVNGEVFWSNRALGKFAYEQTGSGEPEYKWAREFAAWAERQSARICSKAAFNAARYDARLGERLIAVHQGDLSHLGRFTTTEDEVIKDFFMRMTSKRRLTAGDWVPLLKTLPGRSMRGILRRFDELGREYAFIHGYAEYAKSFYHRKFSALRRRRWAKEGCPP